MFEMGARFLCLQCNDVIRLCIARLFGVRPPDWSPSAAGPWPWWWHPWQATQEKRGLFTFGNWTP